MTFSEALVIVGQITDWARVWERLRKGNVPYPLDAEPWTEAEFILLEHAMTRAKIRHDAATSRGTPRGLAC
jgi:hypothetical protein